MKKQYPLKCQACGAERWSRTGRPAWCPVCHGLMMDEDAVEADVERFRKSVQLPVEVSAYA